jgi:hypothetical protein
MQSRVQPHEEAVGRSTRSDVTTLKQEARAMELLADEADYPPERLQDYWAISAELITLVAEVDAFAGENPNADFTDPRMLDLRRRLRTIASRLAELTLP